MGLGFKDPNQVAQQVASQATSTTSSVGGAATQAAGSASSMGNAAAAAVAAQASTVSSATPTLDAAAAPPAPGREVRGLYGLFRSAASAYKQYKRDVEVAQRALREHMAGSVSHASGGPMASCEQNLEGMKATLGRMSPEDVPAAAAAAFERFKTGFWTSLRALQAATTGQASSDTAATATGPSGALEEAKTKLEGGMKRVFDDNDAPRKKILG